MALDYSTLFDPLKAINTGQQAPLAIGQLPNLDYSSLIANQNTQTAPPVDLPLANSPMPGMTSQVMADPTEVNPMDQYKQLLSQVPQSSNFKPHWYDRIGAMVAGAGGGPDAAHEYQNYAYQKAYQDWARKVGAEQEGLKIGPEIQSLQNKPLLDYYKLQGEQARANEEKARTELLGKQVSGYQPPMSFDQRKELKEDVPDKTYKPSETDETRDTILQGQGIDPAKATPQQKLKATQEALKMLHPVTPAQNFGEEIAKENQLFREQDKASANIDKVETPITQDASRISRLDDLLSSGSQATDPTIAPEMLQVITQGKGRMSEAEIKRILGGPDKQQQFWNFINSLKPDSNNRYQMPQVTQDQIKQMIKVMRERNDRKLNAINDARQELEDTTNPAKILPITNKLKKNLSAIDSDEIKPTVPKVFSWSKYHAAHPNVSQEEFHKKVMDVGGKAVD